MREEPPDATTNVTVYGSPNYFYRLQYISASLAHLI